MLFLIANFIKSTLDFRLSFCMMWFLCVSTVLTEMKSLSAISWLVSPSPQSFRISIWRELRAALSSLNSSCSEG